MSLTHRSSNITFILSETEIAMLCTVNIFFSIIGSLGNIFVCFSFVTYPQVRHLLTVFILSLAWSDLLVSLIAQPMFVVSLVKGFKQQGEKNDFEDTRQILTWISLLASAGNLLGVTIHRYVTITRPLTRNARATKTCTLVFLALIWSIAIGLGASTLRNTKMKFIGQAYVFIAVMCLIAPIYTRVLCIARKQQRHILATTTVRESGDVANLKAERRKSHQRRERTALRTIGIISTGFVLGWFPLLTFPFVYRAYPQHRRQLFNLFQWVNTFALCSSAFNPVVYSWSDRQFRQSLKIVYKRWAIKRLISIETSAV